MSQLESTTTAARPTTPTSNDATTPTTPTSGGPATTTSPQTTATNLTSPTSSPPTSGTVETLTPTSETPAPTTTTSSLVGSTRTSQSTPSSTVPGTGSQITVSSSSSIPPSTTSSTASSSSLVLSSTITEPPTSSSSEQGTPTTVTSSFTTYVNGSAVVTQTSIPSTIPAPVTSSNDRAAIVGGSAAGGIAVLILLLSLAFCARRKRFKRLSFLDAITLRRKQIRSRVNLLDGEDLADVNLARPSPRYSEYQTPRDVRDGSDRALMAGNGTPGTPHTHGSRWSETGSASKDEAWHPPHESMRLMDPFANRNDLDIDLGRIVDDVMGTSATVAHYSAHSVSSMYRDSMAATEDPSHSRTVSNASNAALLDAAGFAGGTSTTAPVRPSPLAQSTGAPPRSGEDRGAGAF